MSAIAFDDDLVRRLPLPLAQLYRRAHNAKSPQERHHAAYYLWEASLKLLGSAAIVEYAGLQDDDKELGGRLKNLARPALGHWWEFVRRLIPVLAGRGDSGFTAVRDLVLGPSRDDLPHAAGLDGVLLEVLDAKGGARATVRLSELFDRLVRYRNQEFGHGATGQKPAAFYGRVGMSLLAGLAELLSRLDVLAGRRLIHVGDVRRQASGRWLVERYELRGETPRRLESLDLPEGEAAGRLLPECLYLETLFPVEKETKTRIVALRPLLTFDADNSEVLFVNARRGRRRIEYLSYSSGRVEERADLAPERRDFLARILHMPVDEPSLAEWAAKSQAEEPVTDASEESNAPRRLGEFELLSELGRGGMGVVYRAWQPSLGRQVAVKSLFRTGDPKAEARFAREIRALGHVEHPHLVKIFTSGSDGEQWFYAMELVEGATLAAVCDRLHDRGTHPATVDFLAWQNAVSTVCAEARKAEKSLSRASQISGQGHGVKGQKSADGQGTIAAEQAIADGNQQSEIGNLKSPVARPSRSYVHQVVELVKQVAEAAHALHERGILHRDIKPGNVMVTAEGTQVVLMDLGLAQIADEVEGRLTKTRQFVGTLRYASPEQVLAVGGLDRRSDVYSLGATLWELLTLRPMFNADDRTPTPELMRRIQVEEPAGPRHYHPGLSRDLEAIVLRCLEKDAGRRYSTAQELVHDLERYQASEPVKARPVGRLQRGWRWCRRKPAQAALAAVSLLAVAILLGAWVSFTLQLRDERNQAVVARAQAEENFQLARNAVNRYYTEVSETELLHQPGMQPLQKKLLAAAADFYQQFVARETDNKELTAELAKAHYRLAEITFRIGSKQDAVAHYEKARSLQEELLTSQPDSVAIRADLAVTLNHLGLAYKDIGRPSAAIEAVNQQSRTLWEALVREFPRRWTYQEELAEAWHNLGWLFNDRNRNAEAETAYLKAIAIRDVILAAKPDLLQTRHYLAGTLNNLGNVYFFTGRLSQAEEAFRRALVVRRELVREYPKRPQFQEYLAMTSCNMARIYTRTNRKALALETYQNSLTIFEKLTRDFPDVNDFKQRLSWNYNLLGNLHKNDEQFLKAEEAFRKGLEIRARLASDNPLPFYQNNLAGSYNNLGSLLRAMGQQERAIEAHRHALKILEPLSRSHPGIADYRSDVALTYYNLARAYAPKEAEPTFKKALNSFEELINAHAEVPYYREMKGFCLHQLGLLYEIEHRQADARSAFKQALTLRTRLTTDYPDNTDYREQLSATRHNLERLSTNQNEK